jgi:hypothetical protein
VHGHHRRAAARPAAPVSPAQLGGGVGEVRDQLDLPAAGPEDAGLFVELDLDPGWQAG